MAILRGRDLAQTKYFMKKLLIPALAAAALAAVGIANGATFIDGANDASHNNPYTFGVTFTVPSSGITISDIQVFDVQAGNLLRVGLWANGAANGIGNAIYQTTLPSTGAGAGPGKNGFVSTGAIAPIVLAPGSGDF